MGNLSYPDRLRFRLTVQKMDSYGGAGGFREKHEIRGDGEGGCPFAGGLLSHMVGTGRHQVMVQAENKRARHGQRQKAECQAPVIACTNVC